MSDSHPETMPDWWRPPTPYEPGNLAALKHGARSERMIALRAAEVHAALLDVAPWVAEDRYLPSVDRYIKATAREQLAHEAIVNSEKVSPRLLEAATAAARLAWQMADALGLTPAGHAKLKMLVAGGEHAEASLADVRANGRAALERRKAALATTTGSASQSSQEPTDTTDADDDTTTGTETP